MALSLALAAPTTVRRRSFFGFDIERIGHVLGEALCVLLKGHVL
jgi:hypothetical protein